MSEKGWELFPITSGLESRGDKDNIGIYVTRYLFLEKKRNFINDFVKHFNSVP